MLDILPNSLYNLINRGETYLDEQPQRGHCSASQPSCPYWQEGIRRWAAQDHKYIAQKSRPTGRLESYQADVASRSDEEVSQTGMQMRRQRRGRPGFNTNAGRCSLSADQTLRILVVLIIAVLLLNSRSTGRLPVGLEEAQIQP